MKYSNFYADRLGRAVRKVGFFAFFRKQRKNQKRSTVK